MALPIRAHSVGLGFYRDLPSHLIPEGGAYDLLDIICNQPGKWRKRGGTTAVVIGAQTAYATGLGRLGGASGVLYWTRDYPGSSSTAQAGVVATATGTKTTFYTSSGAAVWARPFQYLDYLIFGRLAGTFGGVDVFVNAGSTGAKTDYTFASPGSISMVAGSPVITIGGSDNTSSLEVGMMFYASNAAPTKYFGRITSITDSTHFTVSPAPSAAFVPTAASGDNFDAMKTSTSSYIGVTGYTGCAFQNRIVWGNCWVYDASTGKTTAYPRRIYWSILPTEAFSNTSGNNLGEFPLYYEGIERLNYVDIPITDSIVSINPSGDGELLILCGTSAWLLTGSLTTQTTTSGGITFDVHRVSASVGCLNARSVQYTPLGLVFASYDGVYAYDGRSFKNLMRGAIADYFKARVLAGDTVYGSGLLGGDHYYLSMSGTDGGLLCNLTNGQWSRISNVTLFDCVADPTNPTKTWGLRWWDYTAAAPSMTNGQLVRVDPILVPASTNTTDADTTTVTSTVLSRAYGDPDPGQLKRFRKAVLTHRLNGSAASATVSADNTLSVPDASYTSLGTLTQNTEPTDADFSTLSVLQGGLGLAVKVVQTGATTGFEILELKTQQRPFGPVRAA